MDLLKWLESDRIVERKELDLTELSDAYQDDQGQPIKLPFRVNWTRDMKRARSEIRGESLRIGGRYKELVKEFAAEDCDEERRDQIQAEIAQLNEEARELAGRRIRLWSRILLLEEEELERLIAGLPEPHWSWVQQRVFELVFKWESEQQKKVNAPRSRGNSTEEKDGHQTS
jgi:hypothetical protein